MLCPVLPTRPLLHQGISAVVKARRDQPACVHLREKILRSLHGVREVVPELPHITLFDRDLREALQALTDKYVRQQNEAGQKRWRLRARCSVDAERTYINRRADQVMQREKLLASQKVPASGRHPAVEVDKQAAVWDSKWESSDHVGVQGIAPFLANVPRPARCQFDFTFTADNLRRAAAHVTGKSPGPDAWTAEALVRLPVMWWHYAADLWNRAMALHCVPAAWTRGKTCLLWKDNDKTRPITVLPVLWRAGAQLLNRWLSDWASLGRAPLTVGAFLVPPSPLHFRCYNRRSPTDVVLPFSRTLQATLTASSMRSRLPCFVISRPLSRLWPCSSTYAVPASASVFWRVRGALLGSTPGVACRRVVRFLL